MSPNPAEGNDGQAASKPTASSNPASSPSGQPAATPAGKKTKQEIRAAFRTVFGDFSAAKRQAERMTLAKRLGPYREQVLLLREAKYSWKRIAEGMRKPPISERVSAEALKAVFGDKPKQTAAKAE